LATEEILTWLYNLPSKIRPGLDRVLVVLQFLGLNDKKAFADIGFIHIAGTNGKGSTASFIYNSLRSLGYSTGLYISPHVINIYERIQYNGRYIKEDAFIYWASSLKKVLAKLNCEVTFFEFLTLLAFCYFCLDVKPAFVVFETGLGGRLDATNVVYPLVSIITNIGFDHQDVLGSTLEEIALEKAGIIKNDSCVVCGPLKENIKEIICNYATKKNSLVYLYEDSYIRNVLKKNYKQSFEFRGCFGLKGSFEITLLGKHQVKNAAVSLMTFDFLNFRYGLKLEESFLKEGLLKTSWPCRLEIVNRKPLIILDGAHNIDGIKALSDFIASCSYKRLFVVFSMLKNKNITSVLNEIMAKSYVFFVTESNHKAAYNSFALRRHLMSLYPFAKIEEIKDPLKALKQAVSLARADDLIVVTGSLYLLAQIRNYFFHEKGVSKC